MRNKKIPPQAGVVAILHVSGEIVVAGRSGGAQRVIGGPVPERLRYPGPSPVLRQVHRPDALVVDHLNSFGAVRGHDVAAVERAPVRAPEQLVDGQHGGGGGGGAGQAADRLVGARAQGGAHVDGVEDLHEAGGRRRRRSAVQGASGAGRPVRQRRGRGPVLRRAVRGGRRPPPGHGQARVRRILAGQLRVQRVRGGAPGAGARARVLEVAVAEHVPDVGLALPPPAALPHGVVEGAHAAAHGLGLVARQQPQRRLQRAVRQLAARAERRRQRLEARGHQPLGLLLAVGHAPVTAAGDLVRPDDGADVVDFVDGVGAGGGGGGGQVPPGSLHRALQQLLDRRADDQAPLGQHAHGCCGSCGRGSAAELVHTTCPHRNTVTTNAPPWPAPGLSLAGSLSLPAGQNRGPVPAPHRTAHRTAHCTAPFRSARTRSAGRCWPPPAAVC